MLSINLDYKNSNSNFIIPQKYVPGGANFPATKLNSSKRQINNSNNGTFELSEAGKNFLKGIISPITGMFSSTQNFIAGVGMITGSAAVIAITGGAAAPLFIAAGVGIGTIQASQGIYKISKAKNGDEFEKAFYDVGSATSSLGLSTLGAKNALKIANIETNQLNPVSATIKNIKNIKDSVVECFNVFKTGYYKRNISAIKKIFKQPSQLLKYATKLHKEGESTFTRSLDALKEVFPEELRPSIKGRNKSQISIYEKLVKESTTNIDEIIKKIKNSELPEAEKQTAIANALEKRKQIQTDISYAKSIIEDRFGARLVMDDVSEKSMDSIVEALVRAIKNGDIKISEIENYRGLNNRYEGKGTFYFNQKHLQMINEADPTITVLNKSKTSGYAAVQLKIKPKNGELMELQIRGKDVDAFADIEHYPYDLRQNKDISRANNKIGLRLLEVERAIKSLTAKQYESYQKYIYENYINAQYKEFGHAISESTLPEGINPVLSVENLRKIHSETAKYNHGTAKLPFILSPEISTIAGLESLSES